MTDALTRQEKRQLVFQAVAETIADIEYSKLGPDSPEAVEELIVAWVRVQELCIRLWPEGPDDILADVLLLETRKMEWRNKT